MNVEDLESLLESVQAEPDSPDKAEAVTRLEEQLAAAREAEEADGPMDLEAANFEPGFTDGGGGSSGGPGTGDGAKTGPPAKGKPAKTGPPAKGKPPFGKPAEEAASTEGDGKPPTGKAPPFEKKK
jgi:hypothetical protein